TVYNYGPDAGLVLDETAPQNPVTRKGAIRAEMERRLAGSGLPVLVLRAGDFFGALAGNNWFAQSLVTPGRPVAAISNPGAAGVGHQWAYLPDVAETMLRLVETVPATGFQSFHMVGQWDATGTGMAEAIRIALGRPDLPLRRFPWRLVRLAAPVLPLFRELAEMRYLWQQPLRLTNVKLEAAIGPEPRTPLLEAVRDTLAGLGCLSAGAAGAAPVPT
ncbi:MAG: epimerase, partial [Mangrovicoccus sp.]|nr:epimerase [Mangrovicoccus sp.]